MAFGMHKLTGIAFSHYVEKARWALDRYAVPYEDERVLPFFHFWYVNRLHGGRAGQADKASSRYSTPVLRTPAGEFICDSSAIVRYVSDTFAPEGETLDPGPEGEAIEARLHDVLGPHARRVGYSALFERPAVLRQVVRNNVSRAQSRLFSPLVPVARLAMHRVFDISDEAAARSADIVRREFDWIAELLEDGRPFLAGEHLTSTDIAFACMSAISTLPPKYSAWLPQVDVLSERIAGPMRELQAHPAGQFSRRLFAEERRRVIA